MASLVISADHTLALFCIFLQSLEGRKKGFLGIQVGGASQACLGRCVVSPVMVSRD